MTVTPILPSPNQNQQTGGTAQRQAEPSDGASGKGVLSSDFETFLKMLTTQAKYQDPLEPLDSSEYAAQLAQFSMVEQQVTTNDLMSRLIGAIAPSDMAGFANWIGREALTISPAAFDGTPITLRPDPASGADQVVLIVSNANDVVVQEQAMPATNEPVQWAGVRDDGSPFPPGEYSFEFESRSNGDIIAVEPARTYTRVTEARIENGETMLLLDSGYLVRSADVLGLRDPA